MPQKIQEKRTVELLRDYEKAFSDGCFIQVSLALTGQMEFGKALDMVASALDTPGHIESLGEGAEHNLQRAKTLLERLNGSQERCISLRGPSASKSGLEEQQEAVELATYSIEDSQLDAIVENRMSLPVDESEKYHGGFNVEMVRSPTDYMARTYYLGGWKAED